LEFGLSSLRRLAILCTIAAEQFVHGRDFAEDGWRALEGAIELTEIYIIETGGGGGGGGGMENSRQLM
jgi:hypothetical protein